MDYTIYPFEGLGAIRFGMTPQQVREVIGEPDSTFMKSDKFPTDDYFDLGFHVYYNESGLCEAMEIFSPYAQEDPFGLDYTEEPGDCTTLNFQGQIFFKQTFVELKTWFQSLGTGVQHYDCGVTFLKFGIVLYSREYSFPGSDTNVPPEIVYICNLNAMEEKVSFNAPRYPFEPEISS
jgi:hypothetical protein